MRVMLRRLVPLMILPLVMLGWHPVAASPADARMAVKDVKIALISESEPVVGSAVAIAVSLPKRTKGSRVSLLRRSETGGWVVVQKAKASKRSLTISGPVTAMGDTKWRVVARDKRGVTHKSNIVRTKVFAWLPLSSVPGTPDGTIGGNSYWREAVMGGVQYQNSLVNNDEWMFNDEWWGGYTEVFTLGYKCKSFRASVGVLDASDSGLTVSFSALRDSSPVEWGTFGLGPAVPVTTDLTSVLKLTLMVKSGPGVVNYDVDGYAGWGTPQVLCSATPVV